MSENENATTTVKYPVLKPKDAVLGQPYSLTSAKEVVGDYGLQLRGVLAEGKTVYLPETNPIFKGVSSGKLTLPLSIAAGRNFSAKGTTVGWQLAKRSVV